MSVYGGLVPLGFDPFHSCACSANMYLLTGYHEICRLTRGKGQVYDEAARISRRKDETMSDWMNKRPEECAYSFTQHTACEFFPCHETAHPEDFNCLFCYCPLYALGSRCGGNFVYLENGVKDCSRCLLPHGRGSYSYVLSKYPELAELAKKNR